MEKPKPGDEVYIARIDMGFDPESIASALNIEPKDLIGQRGEVVDVYVAHNSERGDVLVAEVEIQYTLTIIKGFLLDELEAVE